MFEFNPGNAWSLSSVWSLYSGLPFTEIISYYDKYNIQNPFEVLPNRNMCHIYFADKNWEDWSYID